MEMSACLTGLNASDSAFRRHEIKVGGGVSSARDEGLSALKTVTRPNLRARCYHRSTSCPLAKVRSVRA